MAVFFVTRYLTEERLPVHAAVASMAELTSTISTNGRVEPVNNYEFHASVATTVKAVYVKPGDRVPVGKLLMQLDDAPARARLASAVSALKSAQAGYDATLKGGTQEELQQLHADTQRAQLDLDSARRDLTALEKLQAAGAASAGEVAQAKARLAGAETSLSSFETRQHSRYSSEEIERSRAALADAQANYEASERVLADTSLRATIAGTVYSVSAAPTDFVEEGKVLMQLADLRQVRVRAYFDEPEVGSLAVGQPIVVVWDARQGHLWHGHVISIPATIITYGTRNVGEVLVAIDDDASGLLPDTNVTVTVTTSSVPNTLTVPREALHFEGGKPDVYRIVNGRLKRTQVKIGTPNVTMVAIVSGLQAGDMVATGTTNGQPLEEGVPIEVVR